MVEQSPPFIFRRVEVNLGTGFVIEQVLTLAIKSKTGFNVVVKARGMQNYDAVYISVILDAVHKAISFEMLLSSSMEENSQKLALIAAEASNWVRSEMNEEVDEETGEIKEPEPAPSEEDPIVTSYQEALAEFDKTMDELAE